MTLTLNLSNLAHTYSIVAHDPNTGEMGVAVQSHWFSVGSVVSWAEAGVGAIATQSLVNISFGPYGLELLKAGHTAQEVVNALLENDEGRDVRQLAIIDTAGNVATHTGSRCIAEAGHQAGETFSVQANLMLNNTVWPAMAEAYEQSDGPLAERMLTALEAAQAEGGDIRGKQSAALLVVRGEPTGEIWRDRLIDLRIEDHSDPVHELKRLLHVHRTYEFMNAGDDALEKNDVNAALAAYGQAERMLSENLEMRFWHAVALANVGNLTEALPKFKVLFEQDAQWALVADRIHRAGFFNVDTDALDQILAQRPDS